MAPVYSVRLYINEGSSGTETITAADGFTTVVRDIDLFCANASLVSSNYLTITIGEVVLFWATCGPDTTIVVPWRGRQILNAGDTLSVTYDGTWSVIISGYELQSP